MISKLLEEAFSQTTAILLGKPMGKMQDYSAWLTNGVPIPYLRKSSKSGKDVWMPPMENKLSIIPEDAKILSFDELDLSAVSPLQKSGLDGANVQKILSKIVKPIAAYCGNFRYKTYENIEKTSGAGSAFNVYMSEDVYHDIKNVAYSNGIYYCTNIFGSHAAIRSNFGIHLHNCINLSRCFECDGCQNSSDLYFCHNVENCQECLFCFNVKSKRYAIGNVECKKEDYLRLKKTLLGEIAGTLEKTNRYPHSIFNIGQAKTTGKQT